MNKYSFNSTLLFLVIIGLSSMASAQSKKICTDGVDNIQTSAWGFSSSDKNRFAKDYTLPKNKNVSTKEKIDRISRSYIRLNGNVKASGYTPKQIATAATWAAECTGNDFQIFAGLLRAESNLCYNRHNRSGGDSGCGQFTSSAIDFYKNQLRLSGRKSTGTTLAKTTMENMISSCLSKSKYVHVLPGSFNGGKKPTLETFRRLFNGSKSSIRSHLRKGSAMHIDILATAVFLKFKVAKAGGYTVPGRRAGGLARYNGGGVAGYYKKVLRHSETVKLICEDDTYTPYVLMEACDLENDVEVCREEVLNDFNEDQPRTIEI